MVAAAVIAAGGFEQEALRCAGEGHAGVHPRRWKGGRASGREARPEDAIAREIRSATAPAEDLAAALANGAIGEYSVMAKFTQGLGGRWQAHHLLEVKMAGKVGLQATDRVPSVILSEAEHKLITGRLKLKTPGTKTAQELWQAYQEVYKKHPAWLAAIKSYFLPGP